MDFARLRPERVKQGIKKRLREHQRTRPLALEIAVAKGFDYSDRAEDQQAVLSTLSMLRPYDCKGFDKRRVGSQEDGGYVMIDDLVGLTGAYSFGINDDVSWDSDFASITGKPIHMYDHTIKSLPREDALFRWRKIGIAEKDNVSTCMRSVQSLLAENKHEACRDLILKCDIEGCEWKILASKDAADFLDSFRQIVIELHDMQDLDDPEFGSIAHSAICNLTHSHRVVHVHANNFMPYCVVAGVPLPSVLELTLLRKDRGDFEPNTTTFPTKLDAPNSRKKADHVLGTFVFS